MSILEEGRGLAALIFLSEPVLTNIQGKESA
jgi:hypothetical protein